ncbi:MAG: DUF1566 domain-containing protein [Leptospirales bacterium]|nr:DUF1566 domain-containing protein [Leptospirales bacterium]
MLARFYSNVDTWNMSLKRMATLAAALVLVVAAAASCKSEEDEDWLGLLLSSSGVTDNYNGTVNQVIGTGTFSWMKCTQGQAWNAALNNCAGTGSGTVYGATSLAFCTVITGGASYCTTNEGVANSGPAYDSCSNLVFAGQSDWRLPTQGELASLAAFSSRSALLYTFPQTPDDKYFWTGSANTTDTDGTSAWSISFAENTFGDQLAAEKDTPRYVRCIRP